MPKYRPVAIPAGPLTHKNWTLPEIGTNPYPDRDEGDDLDSFTVQHFGSYRELYESIQQSRVGQWGETVAAYEADPRRFGLAWRYLTHHPILYKFRMEEDELLEEILQERNLDHDYGITRIHYEVAEWCSQDWDCDNEECRHQKVDIHWMEFGKWGWPRDKDERDQDFELRLGGHGYHDPALDVYGDTYEECILQAAYLVWQKYGSDRRIADKEN
jgi:hypothetical protein